MHSLLIYCTYEVRRLLLSPVTYAAAALFLIFTGILYFLLLFQLTDSAQSRPTAAVFFSIFWLPHLMIIPLLTMRSLAEERRYGLLESLFVTPARPLVVAISKFTSTYLLYVLFWLLTLSMPWIASIVIGSAATQAGILDMTSLMGGYLFIALSSIPYVALGVFCSSLTKSQLAAGMLTFASIFALILGIKIILTLPLIENWQLEGLKSWLDALDPFLHLSDFCRGIIDSRPCLLYPAFGLFFIGLTSLVLEAKA